MATLEKNYYDFNISSDAKFTVLFALNMAAENYASGIYTFDFAYSNLVEIRQALNEFGFSTEKVDKLLVNLK